MKKEVFFKNILSMMLILVMGGIFVISSKIFYRETVIELISNDLYKNDVTYCIQTEQVKLSELISASNDTFLSKTLSENTRAIYFSSNYLYQIPIIEGRFFTHNDFKEKNRYVVVGKNMKPYLHVKQNKMYYNYLGTEYEVIGIAGFDIQSQLDNIVFFNLVNVFEQAPQNTEIVMGESMEEINQNLQILKIQNSITILDIPNTGISRVWSAPNIYFFITCVTYFSCLVAVLFVIYLKSYYYSNWIKVFKLLGFNNRFIYRKVVFIESIFYIIAFYLGAAFTYSFFMRDFYFDKKFLYRIMGYSVISCIIIIIFNFFYIKRENSQTYQRR